MVNLALRIIATVIMGLSCFTCFLKNTNIFTKSNKAVIISTVYGLLWRAFVITALWII